MLLLLFCGISSGTAVTPSGGRAAKGRVYLVRRPVDDELLALI